MAGVVVFSLLLATTVLSSCSVRVDESLPMELRGKIALGTHGRLSLIDLLTFEPWEGPYPHLARGSASFPSWSPDGKRLVVARLLPPYDPTGSPIIVDGHRIPEGDGCLVILDGETGSYQETLRTGALACDFPSWSPDGSKIAFLGLPPASFRMEPEPMVDRLYWRVRRFFDNRIGHWTGRVDPTWGTLYVADLADKMPVRVTDIRSLPGRPSWSPDSREIMFATVADSQMVTVNLSGTVTRRLGRGVEPAWSPDGTAIAFYLKGAIYTKKIDGTGRRLAVPAERVWSRFSYWGPLWPYTDGGVIWSPDNQYLLYLGADRFDRTIGAPGCAYYVVVRLKDLAMAPLGRTSLLPRGCSWTK